MEEKTHCFSIKSNCCGGGGSSTDGLTVLFIFPSNPPRRRHPGGLLFLIHQPPGGVTGITTFSHLKANDFLFLSHWFSFALLMDAKPLAVHWETPEFITIKTFSAVIWFIFFHECSISFILKHLIWHGAVWKSDFVEWLFVRFGSGFWLGS